MNDIKFQFEEDESLYTYAIVFWERFPNYVDVRVRLKNGNLNGQTAWLQKVAHNEIIWEAGADRVLHLTPAVKDYIERIVKLKAFW